MRKREEKIWYKCRICNILLENKHKITKHIKAGSCFVNRKSTTTPTGTRQSQPGQLLNNRYVTQRINNLQGNKPFSKKNPQWVEVPIHKVKIPMTDFRKIVNPCLDERPGHSSKETTGFLRKVRQAHQFQHNDEKIHVDEDIDQTLIPSSSNSKNRLVSQLHNSAKPIALEQQQVQQCKFTMTQMASETNNFHKYKNYPHKKSETSVRTEQYVKTYFHVQKNQDNKLFYLCCFCNFQSQSPKVLKQHYKFHAEENERSKLLPVHNPTRCIDPLIKNPAEKHVKENLHKDELTCYFCSFKTQCSTVLRKHYRSHTGETRCRSQKTKRSSNDIKPILKKLKKSSISEKPCENLNTHYPPHTGEATCPIQKPITNTTLPTTVKMSIFELPKLSIFSVSTTQNPKQIHKSNALKTKRSVKKPRIKRRLPKLTKTPVLRLRKYSMSVNNHKNLRQLHRPNGREKVDRKIARVSRRSPPLGKKLISKLQKCSVSIENLPNLNLLATKVPKNKYICYFCNYKPPTYYRLMCHYRSHTGEKPLNNWKPTCTTNLTKNTRHPRNLPKHSACLEKLAEVKRKNRHQSIHKKSSMSICYFCNFKTSSSNILLRHYRSHTREKPYSAIKKPTELRLDTCVTSRLTDVKFKSHPKVPKAKFKGISEKSTAEGNHPNPTGPCTTTCVTQKCEESPEIPTDEDKPVNDHVGLAISSTSTKVVGPINRSEDVGESKSLLCDTCGTSCMTSMDFERHLEEHKTLKIPEISLPDDDDNHKHPVQVYMLPSSTRASHRIDLSEDVEEQVNDLLECSRGMYKIPLNNLQCLKCFKIFKSKQYRIIHEKLHKETFSCSYCPQVFDDIAGLRLHNERNHVLDRIHKISSDVLRSTKTSRVTPVKLGNNSKPIKYSALDPKLSQVTQLILPKIGTVPECLKTQKNAPVPTTTEVQPNSILSCVTCSLNFPCWETFQTHCKIHKTKQPQELVECNQPLSIEINNLLHTGRHTRSAITAESISSTSDHIGHYLVHQAAKAISRSQKNTPIMSTSMQLPSDRGPIPSPVPIPTIHFTDGFEIGTSHTTIQNTPTPIQTPLPVTIRNFPTPLPLLLWDSAPLTNESIVQILSNPLNQQDVREDEDPLVSSHVQSQEQDPLAGEISEQNVVFKKNRRKQDLTLSTMNMDSHSDQIVINGLDFNSSISNWNPQSGIPHSEVENYLKYEPEVAECYVGTSQSTEEAESALSWMQTHADDAASSIVPDIFDIESRISTITPVSTTTVLKMEPYGL